MSWGTNVQGNVDQVCAGVAEAITDSAKYDPRLTKKAEEVAKVTGALIRAAVGEPQSGKRLFVSSYGHLDHGGMANYTLNVTQDYLDSEIKPVTEEQIAEASGTPTSAE